MLLRLGMSMVVIAGIFVLSPARRGDDPARFIAGARDAMIEAARRKATEIEPGAVLAASGALANAPAELRPTIEDLVTRALTEGGRPSAARAPSARAALDTLTASDRRPSWKGDVAG